MTIGIIVHSKTGHTLQVAEQLKASLSKAGRPAALVRIEDHPDLDSFETLVLGSHTEGFALAADMAAYLNALPSKALSQKKVALLITHAFPLHAMGGNQAMSGFKNLVEKQGARVISGEIIDWSRPGRDRQIETAVGRMAGKL